MFQHACLLGYTDSLSFSDLTMRGMLVTTNGNGKRRQRQRSKGGNGIGLTGRPHAPLRLFTLSQGVPVDCCTEYFEAPMLRAGLRKRTSHISGCMNPATGAPEKKVAVLSPDKPVLGIPKGAKRRPRNLSRNLNTSSRIPYLSYPMKLARHCPPRIT